MRREKREQAKTRINIVRSDGLCLEHKALEQLHQFYAILFVTIIIQDFSLTLSMVSAVQDGGEVRRWDGDALLQIQR